MNGLEYWCEIIVNAKKTPVQVAAEFINSTEFINKKYDDTQYLHRLYRTFFGRDEDANGLAYWLLKMSQGTKRDAVLQGFANSTEFKKIVESFGLKTTTTTTKKKKKK